MNSRVGSSCFERIPDSDRDPPPATIGRVLGLLRVTPGTGSAPTWPTGTAPLALNRHRRCLHSVKVNISWLVETKKAATAP